MRCKGARLGCLRGWSRGGGSTQVDAVQCITHRMAQDSELLVSDAGFFFVLVVCIGEVYDDGEGGV